ncbi:sigma-70 family RNA polymerase sigma factor [Sphingomonas sp. NCPPB 2930]|uniref:sigma-70 family RNA polymerase sigma factor n=1 Tax=Sphingomonas sp. NCPPB 2930 TaxID=3162788 RepID=UPI0036DEC086
MLRQDFCHAGDRAPPPARMHLRRVTAANSFFNDPSLRSSIRFTPIMSVPMSSSGLEAVYLANRDKLVRFLVARGAGDSAEDLVNDLWIKISTLSPGPIANPMSYLFRAADTLMIDRYRARRQAERRDQDWYDLSSDGETSGEPAGERVIGAQQEVTRVAAVLAKLGARRETIFRRARIDGVSQRQIATELGVSLSTVEADLRIATRALIELKEDLR